jgi:hypothetical protein
MGVGGVCLLGVFLVGQCSSERVETGSAAASASPAGPTSRPATEARPVPRVASARLTREEAPEAAPAERSAAQVTGKLPAQGGSAPGVEAEVAMQRRLAAASHVISVPPAGRAPLRQGRSPAGAAPMLPPQLEAHRQAELSRWRHAAQELLSVCIQRPSHARQPVALEVAFAPRPRAVGARQQVLMPDWILVPPHELQRLWQATAPDRLQECLARVRGLSMTVPLSGDTLAQGFPTFAESVLLQL